MLIQILGPGCANCHTLERRTREALAELELQADVQAVTDFPTIVSYGIMSTPALAVDGDIVLTGRVPTTAKLRDLLTAAAVERNQHR